MNEYLVSFTVHNKRWIIDDGVWRVEAKNKTNARTVAREELEAHYGRKATIRLSHVEMVGDTSTEPDEILII